MKKLEDMTLEELLEFDKENRILSESEFIIKHPFVLSNYQKYRQRQPIYKEVNRLYNLILDDLSKEIDKHPFKKDPLTLSILVGDYLIPSGILSYTEKFYPMKIMNCIKLIKLEIDYAIFPCILEGIYIAAGYGCCRHYNSFVADLLTKRGIINDKVVCIRDKVKELKKREEAYNFNPNHLIIGYLENGHYYLIDSFNHDYTLKEEENFYSFSNNLNVIIPDFSKNLFGTELHYHSIYSYKMIPEKVAKEKRQKIENLLQKPDIIESFINFKKSHLEIYEKIAYLAPLELERTEEKEKQKQKRI